MKLIDDWKTVLLKAWSVHCAAIAALLSALDALQYVLPALDGVLPPKLLSWLALLAAIGAIGARLIPQRSISGDRP
jgi:hypothetical protein